MFNRRNISESAETELSGPIHIPALIWSLLICSLPIDALPFSPFLNRRILVPASLNLLEVSLLCAASSFAAIILRHALPRFTKLLDRRTRYSRITIGAVFVLAIVAKVAMVLPIFNGIGIFVAASILILALRNLLSHFIRTSKRVESAEDKVRRKNAQELSLYAVAAGGARALAFCSALSFSFSQEDLSDGLFYVCQLVLALALFIAAKPQDVITSDDTV